MLEFGFYNMDCIEGMKQFPDKYFDLAIVDPPYGIKISGRIGGVNITSVVEYHAFDDSKTPGDEYFNELKRVSKNQVIWGGNYFLNYLCSTNCMIIWDKRRRGLAFADCEIAWTSFKKPARIFEYKWNGLFQEDMKNKEKRIHPTQKPVALYEWILNNYANKDDIILDTHVGSASSLIACRNTGHKYVGFEIDPVYYAKAKERLDRAEAQTQIFDFIKE